MEQERGTQPSRRGTKSLLFSFVMVMFLLIGGSFAFASKVLFVVGGDSLSPGDKVIRNHLKGRGFEVVVKTDRHVTAASAVGKDLIVISESVVSTRLKNKFRKVGVPLICLDGYQYDDLGMTARDYNPGSKFGQIEEQQSVQIETGGHPLAARLPAGQIVEVGQRDIIMSWGVPGKNAIRVATLVNSNDKFAIFAYDKGKKMPGLVAPARRIGFFLTSKAAKSLTADGWNLFNAAVNWAVKYEGPQPCSDGNASITFVNNCGETLWVAQLGNGASKKCSSDTDCGVSGNHGSCVNGACDEITCETDQDCGSDIQYCNVSNCKSNSDCPAISCYEDTDCPFGDNATAPQKCMGGGKCESDADCPAIQCTSSTDCPLNGEGVTCNNPSGGNLAGVCTPSCQSDGNCLCSSAQDCPGPNPTCQNNLCSLAVGYCSPACRYGQCTCTTDQIPGLPPPLACTGVEKCENNLCTGVGLCTYKHLPAPGYWRLPADADNNTLQICVPADNNETKKLAWGGRFWARTGCPDNFAACKREGEACDNNTVCCNNSCVGGICQPGVPACLTGDCKTALACNVSGSLPVTLFELNYADPTSAYYDISLADSYNVPIMATPKTANCPAVGCTGNLNAMCPQLLQPSGTPPSCTTSTDCPAGGGCENGSCVIGCISACNQCRDGINVAALQCNTVVPGDNPTNMKYVDLYCCTNNLSCNLGAPTCFDDTDCAAIGCQQNADCSSDNCTARGVCGGMTCDQTTYLCNPLPTQQCTSNAECKTDLGYTCSSGACMPPTNCCGPYNPLWLAAMETYATAFKEACPTAYSYQYDDPTSLFTCPNSGKGVDYTVTFCPSR